MRLFIKTLVLYTIMWGCNSCGNLVSEDIINERKLSTPEVNEVDVVTLERTDFANQIMSNGKLKASRRASLAFNTGGVVSALMVSNGSRISSGNIIAELDRASMKLTLDAAKIALQKAELDLYDVLAGQGFAAKDTLSVPANILAMAKMRSGYTSARNSLDRARLEYDRAVRVCDHDNSEPCIPQICTSHR